MGLRTVTVDRSKSKRPPLVLTVGDRPEDVALILETTGKGYVRMRDRASGYYLGTEGKFVRNGGHARRFNPDKARKFLEARTASFWEAT